MSPETGLSAFADLLNCGQDVSVGATAADVAAHQFFHRSIVGTARFLEKCYRRHDLTRGAVTALVRIALKESCLHGMQCLRRTQPLDGRDLFAIVHQSQAQT